MGADGGVKISKVSDIKKEWLDIKKELIRETERRLNNSSWDRRYYQEYFDKSKSLPDDVTNLTDKEVCDLFRYLSSCDCPNLYNDLIITAEGDNVADQMDILSMVLPGVSIETWT